MNTTLKLNETLHSTLFSTAKNGFVVNAGTGTTLSLTCDEAAGVCTLSGFMDTIDALKLPTCAIFPDTKTKGPSKDSVNGCPPIQCLNNGYVKVTLSADKLSRMELHDQLNGLGWNLNGYSVSHKEGLPVHYEMWALKVKTKSPRSK